MAERPVQGAVPRTARIEYLVRASRNHDELRRVLRPHRAYAAYGLGQLQSPLFDRSEWWISRGAAGQALLLHSKGGLGNALLALGSPEALDAVLRLHPGPRHTFLTCQPQHVDVVLRHFALPERQAMSRMLVDATTFQPASGEVRRLSGSDVRSINALYRSDGTAAFYTAQNIKEAVYYGAYHDNRLIAVAGTHVVSASEGIAVVGNVFTHVRYRGRGLGRLVTSAVTAELLKTCREVVLSVDPRNAAAVRAYERSGFREVGRLVEGAAVRRGIGLAPTVQRWLATTRGRRYGAELVRMGKD
jgi:ribosomal protein S18 acetylase RimI-like enzyme